MTMRAGVIGWPLAHTRSPRLHGHWIARYGLDARYDAYPVAPDALDDFLARLKAERFRGCNVTIPHKEAVAARMDTLTDRARRIGAVNTVVVGEDGRLTGDNTDLFGFIENLKAGAPGFDFRAGPAVVLGAGGAGRAVVAGLLDAGAPELRLTNRSRARAEELAAALGGPCRVYDWEDTAIFRDAKLLVNATALGMTGQAPLAVEVGRLPPGAVVADLVYAPLETRLLGDARARGLTAVGGIGMLLHQARPAFRAWFGIDPAVTPELEAAVLA